MLGNVAASVRVQTPRPTWENAWIISSVVEKTWVAAIIINRICKFKQTTGTHITQCTTRMVVMRFLNFRK